jgi:hypothetical protein
MEKMGRNWVAFYEIFMAKKSGTENFLWFSET